VSCTSFVAASEFEGLGNVLTFHGFQGLGFGRRLFAAARRDLMQSNLKSMVVWALSDNDPATEFYRNLGGRMVARSSERFGPKSLDKVAFAWTN